MPESERRVAIVTGGARGIGRGCAHAIAGQGVDIVLVDLLEDKLPETRREIEAMGVACETFVADVADHARAKEIAAAVLARFGRIDILVNNAGKAQPKGILDVTEDEWDRTIAVNLKSCFNYVQAVAPAMLERQYGRIVSMSSVNAHSGGVTAAVSKFAYASAKAGIIGMTRALSKELGPNICVNCVCPGLIKTEVVGNVIIREREPELIKGVALKRTGTPVDVGNLVAFLATTEPCFITGQDFIIDGMQFNI
ncbi:MAG: SDR family NAD(P)-dependent oxidoreductase [Hyphomicrobiaceae bacterium]